MSLRTHALQAVVLLAAALHSTATPATPLPIPAIQGAGHHSPLAGQRVETGGVVTAVGSDGFFLQDPGGDGDPRTSDAIFVFTGLTPAVRVGDAVEVAARVAEFTPGGPSSGNLPVTELVGPEIRILARGVALPGAIPLGAAGRAPPTETIDDDDFARFEPARDGIDYFESLEAMRVVVPDAVALGPGNRFGEIFVVGDAGRDATGRSSRGVLTIVADDFNPERIQIDDTLLVNSAPAVVTGDRLGDVEGVVGYRFGGFEVLATSDLQPLGGGLKPETTGLVAGPDHLTVATFNVNNLDPGDGARRFQGLASQIVDGLRAPDILALQEIQDDSGSRDDGVISADETWSRLAAAVMSAGGPAYAFADAAPGDGTDGGQPGANIRVGYLYDPARVDLVPGSLIRIEDPAFAGARKPLLVRFRFNTREIVLVNNHLTSRSGSAPLFGAAQPAPVAGTARRAAQSRVLASLARELLEDPGDTALIVLGDFNALTEEEALRILYAGEAGSADPLLHSLAASLLPEEERYSYIFEGNGQLLDHVLVSPSLFNDARPELDIVHLNSEFASRVSDHDPVLVRFNLPVPEPSSFALLALGIGALSATARRRSPCRRNRGPCRGHAPGPARPRPGSAPAAGA